MLDYVLELSADFPSIISGSIKTDISPRSSKADFPCKPKSIVDLLKIKLVPWLGVPVERVAREGTWLHG